MVGGQSMGSTLDHAGGEGGRRARGGVGGGKGRAGGRNLGAPGFARVCGGRCRSAGCGIWVVWARWGEKVRREHCR